MAVSAQEMWGAAGAIERRLCEDASARSRLEKLSGRERDHMLIAMALTHFYNSHDNEGGAQRHV